MQSEIIKLIAKPYSYSSEVKMKDNFCGASRYINIKASSESQMKGRFMLRVHTPTSFTPEIFMGPCDEQIRIPSDCFHLRVSAKSLSGIGQVIRCEIYY